MKKDIPETLNIDLRKPSIIPTVLSAQKFSTKLTADPSLSSRPMKKIIDPLEMMGATIKSENGLL